MVYLENRIVMLHHSSKTKAPWTKIFAKFLLFRWKMYAAPSDKQVTITALLVLWIMMQTKYQIRGLWPQNLNSSTYCMHQSHCGLRQEPQWAIGAKRAHFRMIWSSVNSLRQVIYLASVQTDSNSNRELTTRRIEFLNVDNQTARIKVPTQASFTVTSNCNNEDSKQNQPKKVKVWTLQLKKVAD